MTYITYIIIGVIAVFVLIICFCLSVASFSFENFKAKQASAQKYQTNMTVRDFVERINSDYIKKRLRLEICAEDCDHYSAGVIALSQSTLASQSLSSLSIVAHEMGHAVQYERGELSKHWAAKAKRRILGKFFSPLIVLGIICAVLYLFNLYAPYTLIAGSVFFAAALVIFIIAIYAKYKEIQVEKGASVYGLQMLEEYTTQKEYKICKEFLDSARLTYWGSLFRTMFGWLGISQKDKDLFT